MQIKIVDSWLREFLETKADAKLVARELSLRAVSVDRLEKIDQDYIYDIEVTTNRPDLMNILGIAKEAAAALSEEGIWAKFTPPKIPNVTDGNISFPIEIKNDKNLVNRIMAIVLEVEIGKSPKYIQDRLEASGVRSLNNVVDVTNYVMREIGHPAHVFDYDLLTSRKMIIRQSKKGETITTLDDKKYSLFGGDIIADDGQGQIIDLLGVMGIKNSVVNDKTRRILFFLDNNNPLNIRKTSMSLGIRTEAAVINEKGIDPEVLEDGFKRGVELYQKIAKGKVVSKILDIYPNKPKTKTIKISNKKINSIIGVPITLSKSTEILQKLGFGVNALSDSLEVKVPTERLNDIKIDEDIIEEVARVYGYHKLPSVIPSFSSGEPALYSNNFYFEERIKNALKYWGFTEVYTYSLISEDLYDGPVEKAVKLKNPLTEDMAYLRNSLVPSLLEVVGNNKGREEVRIFEMSNIYNEKLNDLSTSSGQVLPMETLTLSGILKKKNASFFEVKGVLEQLFEDLGIGSYKFRKRDQSPGAEIIVGGKNAGYIEILNQNLVDFELNLNEILKHATNKKTYKPLAKFPQVLEDITFVLGEEISTEDVINEIGLQSFLIRDVTLKDRYKNSKTFHIVYQSEEKNLTNKEVSEIREQIIKSISEKFGAKVK